MKVGITGTRHQITPEQDNTIWKLIKYMTATELHHGDCTGADMTFHAAVIGSQSWNQDHGLPLIRLIIHPPVINTFRAFCQGYDELREPLPYLERNHVIVDEVDLLVAVPLTVEEKPRSGTWATIRYAMKQGKPVIIINSNGGWRLNSPKT